MSQLQEVAQNVIQILPVKNILGRWNAAAWMGSLAMVSPVLILMNVPTLGQIIALLGSAKILWALTLVSVQVVIPAREVPVLT